MEAKALADDLGAVVQGIHGMSMTKPQALAAVTALQSILPAGQRYLAEDLQALRDALEAGRDFGSIMTRLEHDHLSRITFGMKGLAGSAPHPVRPGTITKADPRHPENPGNPTFQQKHARPR